MDRSDLGWTGRAVLIPLPVGEMRMISLHCGDRPPACDTIEDAMSIAAEANGTTEQELTERMRMEVEYLNNLRRGHRPQMLPTRTAKKRSSSDPRGRDHSMRPNVIGPVSMR